jgi:hypothetical protein
MTVKVQAHNSHCAVADEAKSALNNTQHLHKHVSLGVRSERDIRSDQLVHNGVEHAERSESRIKLIRSCCASPTAYFKCRVKIFEGFSLQH